MKSTEVFIWEKSNYVHPSSGCYDGCLYVLKARGGQIHWRFSPLVTKEVRPVKSSPCVDEQTGWIWFGSHDEHLYALDIQVRTQYHSTGYAFLAAQLNSSLFFCCSCSLFVVVCLLLLFCFFVLFLFCFVFLQAIGLS